MKKVIHHILNQLGYKIFPIEFPKDMEKDFQPLYNQIKDYTMTSLERVYALYKSMEYIIHSGIPGDIVECGVWKGGSSMAMAKILLKLGHTNRKLYLYDTYEGMSEPTERDQRISDAVSAMELWKQRHKNNRVSWSVADLKEVKNNMYNTGYPKDKLIFIKGKVEETIPANLPKQIALLRLDTDWYESTYHELKYLYPLLSNQGVLILDDYGHWAGAREAVDQYFLENHIHLLLTRVDGSARIGIKSTVS